VSCGVIGRLGYPIRLSVQYASPRPGVMILPPRVETEKECSQRIIPHEDAEETAAGEPNYGPPPGAMCHPTAPFVMTLPLWY
jgi:hypothetical protein